MTALRFFSCSDHNKGAKHVRVTLEFEVTWFLIVTDFAVRQDVVNGQHLKRSSPSQSNEKMTRANDTELFKKLINIQK